MRPCARYFCAFPSHLNVWSRQLQPKGSCSLSAASLQPFCSLSAAFLQPFCSLFAAFLQPFCSLSAAFLQPFCSLFRALLQSFCSLFAAFLQPPCSLFDLLLLGSKSAAFFFEKKIVLHQKSCYYERTSQITVVLFKQKQIDWDEPSENLKIWILTSN